MKNKLLLKLAILILLLVIILNIPFLHNRTSGETTLFNILLISVNGLDYLVIFSTILTVVSLYFLSLSLTKYHVRPILLALIIVAKLPHYTFSAYQKTIATGVYAISYDKETTAYSFGMFTENILRGECTFSLKNHSGKTVDLTVELSDSFYTSQKEQSLLSLMNNAGPHQVTVSGHRKNSVQIVSYINIE